MSEVIRRLRADHVNLAKLLSLLDMEMRVFDVAGAPDYEMLLDIMDYAMNYPDRCHHPKEDLVFRKLMERDPVSRVVVEELLEEHETLARLTTEFTDALNKVMLDSELPRESLAKLARDYVATNRRHMEREELTVFPLALEALTDQDWTEIDAAINAEDPLFGKDVEEQYLMLHERIVSMPPSPA